MAFTINNFIGFETGGLEEASSTSGAPTVAGVQVDSGNYSLSDPDAGQLYFIDPFQFGGDQGAKYIFGFSFYLASHTTVDTDNVEIMRTLDNTDSTVVLGLYITNTSGTLNLRLSDDNGFNTLGSAAISTGQWYYFEVLWGHSATDTVDVYINGSSDINASADTFGAGSVSSYRLTGNSKLTQYFDDFYCGSGATGTSDFLGDAEVYAHVVDETTATPDFDGVATADTPTAATGGTGTPTGRWDETDDYLTSTYIVYGGGKGGGADGIALNASITEDPTAVKGIWEMQSTTGDTTTTQYGVIGNSGDGVVNTSAFALTATWATYFYGSDSATVKPLASEDLRLGVEVKE